MQSLRLLCDKTLHFLMKGRRGMVGASMPKHQRATLRVGLAGTVGTEEKRRASGPGHSLHLQWQLDSPHAHGPVMASLVEKRNRACIMVMVILLQEHRNGACVVHRW